MSNIGKMTIFVTQTVTGQQIKVRTTGKRGAVLLNTVSEDLTFTSQSPSSTAPIFWADVLTKVQAAL
jgi:hypothetical protein